MLRKPLIILSILFCLAVKADASVDVVVKPEFSVLNGFAEYEMDYYESFINWSTDPPTEVKWRINSLLEFPLKSTMGGMSAVVRPKKNPYLWSITLKYTTSLSSTKSEKMKDSDAEGFETIFPYTTYSYTESDPDFSINNFEVGLQYRLTNKKSFDISLILDGKFQNMNYDILGYEGWYRVFDTTTLRYYTDSTIAVGGYPDTLVLKYKLKVGQIALGFKSNIFLHKNLITSIKAAYAPTFFSDVDDHVLRKKVSKSNGIGHGFKGEFGLLFDVPLFTQSSIELFSAFYTFNAEGSQFQYWYDHEGTTDPSTGNWELLVPEGTSFGKIPHEVRWTQYQVGLRMNVRF